MGRNHQELIVLCLSSDHMKRPSRLREAENQARWSARIVRIVLDDRSMMNGLLDRLERNLSSPELFGMRERNS